jgi:hypothetical protein
MNRLPAATPSISVVVDERCAGDAALAHMRAIIRDADVRRPGEVPEAAGVRRVTGAFPLVAA